MLHNKLKLMTIHELTLLTLIKTILVVEIAREKLNAAALLKI